MREAVVYLAVGGLLIAVTMLSTTLKRLPLTAALLYLGAGWLFGKLGLGHLDEVRHEALLERVTEIAVVLSLFTAGLKIRPRLRLAVWATPLRLAFVSMVLTVALIAVAGVVGLGLSVGGAVLLGAVLAPTDPVLASDVQVEHAGDRDRLRFSLTGEAGLNDGTAFPFVMLGLGLLGHHELSVARWVFVDLLWAVGAGLLIGFTFGHGVSRLVLYLRTHHKEAIGRDEFLALGLITASYGTALLVGAYGFLAVFAAGLGLRHHDPAPQPHEELTGEKDELATDPEKAPTYMAESLVTFNHQLERIAEVALMLVVGMLLSQAEIRWSQVLWFVPLVLFVIRPLAVFIGLIGSRASKTQRRYAAWFGVRGIGSLYYLFYAATHGLAPRLNEVLAGQVLATIAASVVLHGISVTPLMKRYERLSTGDNEIPA